VGIDVTQNFIIESKLRIKEGNVTGFVCLAINAEDVNDHLVFGFNSGGSVKITKTTKQEESIVFPPKKISTYNDTGYNALKIENKNGFMSFYLNNKVVFQDRVGTYKLFSSFVGWQIENVISADVEDLKLSGQFKSIQLSQSASQELIVENLGSNINSVHTEVHPTISHDGKYLFVSRKNYPENTNGTNDDDDAWISTKLDNKWQSLKHRSPN
jgi:hypothetical protein